MRRTLSVAHRLLVAFVAVAMLAGIHATLLRSVHCARANATRHATAPNLGASHVSQTHAHAASSRPIATAASHDAQRTHADHPCPPPLALAAIEPAFAHACAAWQRTSFSGRAPPEPARAALAPIERPPRHDSGLRSA